MDMTDEKLGPFVASVAGAFTGVVVLVRAKIIGNWREFISAFGVGIFFALFLVPALLEVANVNSPRIQSAAGYLGGALGNLMMTGLILYVSNNRGGLVVTLLARLLRLPESELIKTIREKEHANSDAVKSE